MPLFRIRIALPDTQRLQLCSSINTEGINVIIIEIIRTHKWERDFPGSGEDRLGDYFPDYFNKLKLFQCKRCGILLEIRTLRGKYGYLDKNVYLLTDPTHRPFYSGIYSSRGDISKDYSCSQRLIRKALM